MTKPNAVRRLEAAGIDHELRTYDLGGAEFSAAAVAEALGLVPGVVFKTLLVDVEPLGWHFAVVPADTELDLKALATATDGKRSRLAPTRDVRHLTGYPRGAVTVFAARRAFPVVADLAMSTPEVVSVSGGAKGLQVLLRGEDFLRVSGAAVAPIARR